MDPDYVPDFASCILPYTQWYQDDFVGGVRGMRAYEIGIYTMLLMEMYARGRALDHSVDRLARLCGADRRTFEKTLETLIDEGKIVRLHCGLWNERCENAFKDRAKMQAQQKSAAQTSWEKRNQNKDDPERPHSARIASAMPSSEAQIYSDTYVSGATAPNDIRTRLFREGLDSLRRQTGKTDQAARKLIGSWLKFAKDDPARVLTKIRQAEADEVADAAAWVSAALREKSDYDRMFARM